MGFLDRAKELIDQHDDKVDQALDKAGEFAKTKITGHDGTIDSVVDQAQQRTGAGDTTAAPAAAVPDRPADGVEPAPEVPGGPQVDVPAGPGHVPPQR